MPGKQRRSPAEKKRLSLEKDRRNTYGENAKSSRKNLPKAKARPNRANRRATHQALAEAEGAVASEMADAAEQRLAAKRPKTWRKQADVPLGEVLERKKARREGLRAGIAGSRQR